jgi:polysaccharide export outer membrane protein
MQFKWVFFLTVLFINSTSLFAQDLNPGDGIRLTFYNLEDQISGDYFIQQNGNIQFPFIGVIQTRNRKFNDVKQEIVDKYDKLYKNPELKILPLYRINIFGEVKNPGFYYATGIERFSDLLALAGGETENADLSDIYLIRNNEQVELDGEEIMKEGNRLTDTGLQSGDQIYVTRSWWVDARNYAFIFSGVAVLITIISLVMKK